MDALSRLSGGRLSRPCPLQFKLSRELNVTRAELLAKEKRVLEVWLRLQSLLLCSTLHLSASLSMLQLEAENSKVRRGMDEVLTELHKLFLNKTFGDTNALVEAEGLRGELMTAQERADLAEQRTKIVSPSLS